LVTDEKGKKSPEAVIAHLGISDGTVTQVLDGVAEGDTLITYVTMPGAAAPVVSGPPARPAILSSKISAAGLRRRRRTRRILIAPFHDTFCLFFHAFCSQNRGHP